MVQTGLFSRGIEMTYKCAWKPQKALAFDGSTLLSMSSPGAGVANCNPTNTEAWSFSCWWEGKNSTTRTLFSTGYQKWAFQLRFDGTLAIIGGTDTKITTSPITTVSTIKEPRWVCVTFTYDGSGSTSGYSLYVNGIKDLRTDMGSVTLASIASTQNIKVGAYTNSGGADANLLDDSEIHNVAVWDKELSAKEAMEIYYGQEGNPGAGDLRRHSANSNLKAWWLASNSSDDTSTIYDTSGNSFNMTATITSSNQLFDIG